MTKYIIFHDNGCFPACCGHDLTEEEAKALLKELRSKDPEHPYDYIAFTQEGRDSCGW